MRLEDRCDPRKTIPASPLPGHVREETARRVRASQIEQVAGGDMFGWAIIIAVTMVALLTLSYCTS